MCRTVGGLRGQTGMARADSALRTMTQEGSNLLLFFLAISAHLDISYMLALAYMYMVQPHQQAKICDNEYPSLWCICLQGHFIEQSEEKVRP